MGTLMPTKKRILHHLLLPDVFLKALDLIRRHQLKEHRLKSCLGATRARVGAASLLEAALILPAYGVLVNPLYVGNVILQRKLLVKGFDARMLSCAKTSLFFNES